MILAALLAVALVILGFLALSGGIIEVILVIALLAALVLAGIKTTSVQAVGFKILSFASLALGIFQAQFGGKALINAYGFLAGGVLFGIAAFAARQKVVKK